MDAVTAPETLIVLTTSPTGLGHIRVMDALTDGLLPGSEYVKLDIKNIRANKIHALGSRIPILTKITEFYQTNPLAEYLVTKILVSRLKANTQEVETKLSQIKEKYPRKNRLIIVSTHYALAYPIVQIKEKLAQKYGIDVINAVIVTDDSPQRVWAVDGSNIIFAPSYETATKLKMFLGRESKTLVKTISFPVSPRLTQKLSPEEVQSLERQVDPTYGDPLHISIPISGAAVQLAFLAALVKDLSQGNYRFTIIGQETNLTKDFFDKLRSIARAQIAIGADAKQTVNLYESMFFQGMRPAIEITKPSEQTFKAILKPNERGGVIMLLTRPVGRQEYDNLEFLKRHHLLPNDEEQKELENFLLGPGGTIPDGELPLWHYKASHWRAIRLPQDANLAGKFIKKLKEEGIFHTMLSYVPEAQIDLTSDGVSQIWKTLSELVK